MASLPATQLSLNIAEVQSYVRGYHAYKDIWTPYIGKVLLVRREPDNITNLSVVAVIRDDEVVRHIPYNMASMVSQFMRRDVNNLLLR